jgi:endonuclease/exonuclease/phosphatase family metal-dependent hydrolase
VEGARETMIHNVCRTGNLSPTSSENQLPDESLLVDTHEISLHVSAALSDTSAHHVLLGDFNIHQPIGGGADVRSDCSSQQLLSLHELHELSLLLPPETITFQRHDAQRTIDIVFSSPSPSHTLTACCSREVLDHGSDHYPIESSVLFTPHTYAHVSRPL